MAKKDISSYIERLEAFEERLGVTLQSLSAFMDDEIDEDDNYISIKVSGEIHPTNGTKIKKDVELVFACYDSNDRVIGTSEKTYYADDFFGLDTFSEDVYISIPDIKKIRVYPKKG